MGNALEAFAEKLFNFQDQFLSEASEGTHWYLGDQFKEAQRVMGCQVMTCIANSENPSLEGENTMETAVYVIAQGETVPETKAIYRFVIDGLNLEAIMKTVKSDIEIFISYGLAEEAAKEFETSIERLVMALMIKGWPY